MNIFPYSTKFNLLLVTVTTVFTAGLNLPTQGQQAGSIEMKIHPDRWSEWYRPADQPVFTKEYGNNHDAVIFREPGHPYPYQMIVSHETSGAQLWRAQSFSWSSSDWELVSAEYNIGGHYEYDDGVKVNDTYYLFEQGIVYTYRGDLADGDGNWQRAGTYPQDQCDDIGVYYENGLFHIFGEYGRFPHGPDGTSLSHFTSSTGLGDWKLVDTKAVDPNPDGSATYGVGDPTIAKIEGTYYLFCDRESEDTPYRVTGWRTDDLTSRFEYLGEVITPRSNQVDDWDNHRIQDADILYVPELSRYVMVCNMKDIDGNPGGDFESNHLGEGETRVVGFFYSGAVIEIR
ncbi:MAG: hypothetical protein R3281_05220 [Balneolaceae bacterium]|nr:hypothetical protein [Balneolaceae bacterium]